MNKVFRAGVLMSLLVAGFETSLGQAPGQDVAQADETPPPVILHPIAHEESNLDWAEVGRVEVPGLDPSADLPQEPFRDGTDVYLPLGVEGNGFVIFDFQDPEFPVVVSSVEEIASKDVVVANGFAYSVDGNQLHIVDVSQTQFPRVVGSLDLADSYSYYAAATSVTVSGSVAYVTGASGLYVGHFPMLTAIDVSDPSWPQTLGTTTFYGGYDVAVEGSVAYVTNGDRRLYVYDIADPSNITSLGSVITAFDGNATKVQVDGNYAYVYNTWPSYSISVLDVSVPGYPRPNGVARIPPDWVTSPDSPSVGDIAGLRVDEGMVYATGARGVVVVDATRNWGPKPVGRFGPDEFSGGVELMDDVFIIATRTGLVSARLGTAPVAIAGPALDAGGHLFIDASDSFDPDGVIVSYHWSLQNRDELGASFEFDLPIVDASDLEEGVYDVQLVIKDDTGITAEVAFPLAVPGCSVGNADEDQDEIDIKPGDSTNSVNPYSRGVIPVAIFGSETFDVTDVDVATLAFGPSGAPIAHASGHLQDVNYDGFMDLVVHFRTQDTGIGCVDDLATLTGKKLDGLPIQGTDSIRTVGCNETSRPTIWMKDEDTRGASRGGGLVDLKMR
jgi:hypothetical protein